MAVYRRDQIAKHIEQLDLYSQDLRSVLIGTTPDANVCHEYNCESDQFEREFVEISSAQWETRVAHLQIELKAIKTELKKLAVKRKHR